MATSIRTVRLLPGRIAFSATALLLAGCAADPAVTTMRQNSDFEQTPAGRYRFTAVMNAEFPADDPKAEATRLAWLNEAAIMGERCAYNANTNLGSREVVPEGRDPATGAPVGKIVYEGHCR